jgi:hypothetical protein
MTGPSSRPTQHVAGNGEAVLAALRDGHAAEISRLAEALERAAIRANALQVEVMILHGNLVEAQRAYIKATARAETAEVQLAVFRRADAERKVRGLLLRLRDAWRGE